MQGTVWTALALEGIAANLQHYHPLINDAVRKEWNIPNTWSTCSPKISAYRIELTRVFCCDPSQNSRLRPHSALPTKAGNPLISNSRLSMTDSKSTSRQISYSVWLRVFNSFIVRRVRNDQKCICKLRNKVLAQIPNVLVRHRKTCGRTKSAPCIPVNLESRGVPRVHRPQLAKVGAGQFVPPHTSHSGITGCLVTRATHINIREDRIQKRISQF